jgi:hypothetical protein
MYMVFSSPRYSFHLSNVDNVAMRGQVHIIYISIRTNSCSPPLSYDITTRSNQLAVMSTNHKSNLNADAFEFRPTIISNQLCSGTIDFVLNDKIVYCADRLVDQHPTKSKDLIVRASQIGAAVHGLQVLHHLNGIWRKSNDSKSFNCQYVVDFLKTLSMQDAAALFNFFDLLTTNEHGKPVWMQDAEEHRNLVEMELSLQFWAIEIGVVGLYNVYYKDGLSASSALENYDEQWDFDTPAQDAEKSIYYEFTLKLEAWGKDLLPQIHMYLASMF